MGYTKVSQLAQGHPPVSTRMRINVSDPQVHILILLSLQGICLLL